MSTSVIILFCFVFFLVCKCKYVQKDGRMNGVCCAAAHFVWVCMRVGTLCGGDDDDDNNDEKIVGVGIASLASSEVLFISVLFSHFAFVFVWMFLSNWSVRYQESAARNNFLSTMHKNVQMYVCWCECMCMFPSVVLLFCFHYLTFYSFSFYPAWYFYVCYLTSRSL